ncbi:P-loop containing nucleoside triphosphate hydrolase protein [Dichomitus squalens]|uniref:ATP-dependent DNA helicase n=1 Tax=Dichomitus squalens TaxID=114155 RepID=A0A4Q9N305_9APHY|nr:P-loop containing nucleoside triphosphate hydrolase protein [Dichomitus squalens]
MREAQAWLLGIADAIAFNAASPYQQPAANCQLADSIPPAPKEGDPGSSSGINKERQRDTVKTEVKDEESDYDFDSMDVEDLLDPPSNGQSTPPSYKNDYDEANLDTSRTAKLVGFNGLQPTPPPSSLDSAEDATQLTTSSYLLAKEPVAEIQLSPEQRYVLAKVQRGESVFFTGSAGTGKSVLLREIINARGGRANLQLAITASTGIASVNISIGLGKEDELALVARIYGIAQKAYKEEERRRSDLWMQKAQGNWLKSEDWAFLNKDVDESRKTGALDRWKKVETLIIDEISMLDGRLFDKLEYIARKLRKNERPFGGIQLVLSGDFCDPIFLRKVFRQKDQKFVDMLNAIRFGRLDAEVNMVFRQLSREVHYDDGVEPTELYPTRAEVDSANSSRLSQIAGIPKDYEAIDFPGFDDKWRPLPHERVERALKDLIAPKKLSLKEGAQNLIQGTLVNGSLGRVVGFYKPREALEIGVRIGHPDLLFPLYEGLPRELLEQKRKERQQRLDHYMKSDNIWPAVQFLSGPLVLCVPLPFQAMDANGNIQATRDQVPLILAWALSIHKSQGQTLERVRVNLSKIFEKGQVINFDPGKIRAHPRVIEWMAQHDGKIPDELEEHTPMWPETDVDEELELWHDIL